MPRARSSGAKSRTRRRGEEAPPATGGPQSLAAVRRALHILSVALITAGLVVLADVGLTLAWKEPVSTDLRLDPAGQGRGRAQPSSRAVPGAAPTCDRRRASAGHPSSGSRPLAEPRSPTQVETGEAIGRIKIPSIDLDVVVVQGTDTASLQKGPGHYPETAVPGQGGRSGSPATGPPTWRRSAISTSSTPGDEITLEMPYADLHLPGAEARDRRSEPTSRSSTTSATSGWCSPPATRSTAPPSATPCSRSWSTCGCRPRAAPRPAERTRACSNGRWWLSGARRLQKWR